MRIKDLPISERPREKFKKYGSESLSDPELLAIIIGSGTRGHSAIQIAYDLIKERGIYSLLKVPFEYYKNIYGISDVNAMKLSATFELVKRLKRIDVDETNVVINVDYIYEKYSPMLNGIDQEILGIIVLNGKHQIVSEKILFRGTSKNLNTSFKVILKEILLKEGSEFYLFHNHPHSIDAVPSDQDIVFTSAIITECKKYDIRLIDHIIIAEKNYYSFLKSNTNILDEEHLKIFNSKKIKKQ